MESELCKLGAHISGVHALGLVDCEIQRLVALAQMLRESAVGRREAFAPVDD
jgi:hypothetical protein